jgi:hypothetical protein
MKNGAGYYYKQEIAAVGLVIPALLQQRVQLISFLFVHLIHFWQKPEDRGKCFSRVGICELQLLRFFYHFRDTFAEYEHSPLTSSAFQTLFFTLTAPIGRIKSYHAELLGSSQQRTIKKNQQRPSEGKYFKSQRVTTATYGKATTKRQNYFVKWSHQRSRSKQY